MGIRGSRLRGSSSEKTTLAYRDGKLAECEESGRAPHSCQPHSLQSPLSRASFRQQQENSVQERLGESVEIETSAKTHDLHTLYEFSEAFELLKDSFDEAAAAKATIKRLLRDGRSEDLVRKIVGSPRGAPLTAVNLSFIRRKLKKIDLGAMKIVKLSTSIGQLTNLRILRLCCNELQSIPEEIGLLRQLELLDISHNHLTNLPASFGKLERLERLDMSYNQLRTLPAHLGWLSRLKVLVISHNKIKSLPADIIGMKQLVLLNIEQNPIRWLPAEVSLLKQLRKIEINGCPLLKDDSLEEELRLYSATSTPSLKDLAARAFMGELISGTKATDRLPFMVNQFIGTSKACFFCNRPRFDFGVFKGRMIVRHEQSIPIVYDLCCAHWTNEEDRIRAMFRPQTRSEASLRNFGRASTRTLQGESAKPLVQPSITEDSPRRKWNRHFTTCRLVSSKKPAPNGNELIIFEP